MPLDVAVQVVNYRTRRHLEACLPSVVADLEGVDGRVFVLDNASGDDLGPLAASYPGVAFCHVNVVGERQSLVVAAHSLIEARRDIAFAAVW